MFVIAVATLLLAGCSSAAKDPAPEPAESENVEACEMFASSTKRLAEPFAAGAPEGMWDDLRDDFDTAAIHASGTVKERLDLLVSGWASYLDMKFYDGMSDMNKLINNVGTACKADEAEVDYATFNAP